VSRARVAALVAATGAAVFVAMAVVAGAHAVPGPLDAAAHAVVLDAVGGPARLPLIQWVTWLGNHDTLVAGVVLVALLSLVARRPWRAVRVVAASGGGGLVSRGLKEVFARERPGVDLVEAAGWSFPSGHAVGAMIFYGLLASLVWCSTERRGVRAVAVIAGALVVGAVGASRVALGVHYPSDVVAGWAAGAAWLALSQLAVDAVQRRAGAPPPGAG